MLPAQLPTNARARNPAVLHLIFACAAYIAWLRTSSWWRSILLGLAVAVLPYADYYYTVFFLFAAVYLATEAWSLRLHVVPRQDQPVTAGSRASARSTASG